MKAVAKTCAALATLALAWSGGAYAMLAAQLPGIAPFAEIWSRVGLNALMHACPLFEAFCYATGLFI